MFLHSLWGVYSNRHLLRQLGTLRVSDAGFPYWELRQGVVALCPFRDNILVGTSAPASLYHPIIKSTTC